MRVILIPVFNNRISTRLDCTECFKIIKIDSNEIKSIDELKITTNNQFDRMNNILSIHPDTIICNGLTEYDENIFNKNHIQVFPWVHGEFNKVVDEFINGGSIRN